MREKDIGVALAKSSHIIKLVEFSVSLRDSECNFVFEFVYLSPGAWWLIYSLSIAVGSLIMSIIAGNLFMALLAVLSNICLSFNGRLAGL